MRNLKLYVERITFLICFIWLNTYVAIYAASSGNTTFNTSQTISLNTNYKDNLTSSFDTNYYKFVLSQSGCVSVSFSHDYVDKAGNYWSLTLYDGNEKQIVSYSYKGRSSATYSSAKIGLPKGTYYIMVKSSTNFTNSNYNVRVNFDNDPNWEKEYNETFYTANPIPVNNTIHGSIRKVNDIDRYQFVLPDSGYITLSFSHAYIDKSGNYWHSVLYDINEKRIAEYTYEGRSSEVSNSAQIGLPAGTYYLEIRDSTYRSDTQYDFCINYTSSSDWEKEFNETAYTSNTIQVGKPVNASICYINDIDYFKVEISESTYYSINFMHAYIDKVNSYWYVSLLNSGSSNIEMLTFYGRSTSDTSQQIYLNKGIYYIKVSSGNWVRDVTYSLRLDKHIHNYDLVDSVIPASLSENGKIIMKCSCGATGNEIVIDRPQMIRLSDTQFLYDGKKKTPFVFIEDSNGKVIDPSNYTVKYAKQSKNVGKYNVKIIFSGNYSGNVSKSFTIVPKGTRIIRLKAQSGGFVLKIKKQKIQTTGYQIQYSTRSDFKKSKTRTTKNRSQTFWKVEGLKKKTKYYIRVRTYKIKANKKYYSSWSKVKSVKTK